MAKRIKNIYIKKLESDFYGKWPEAMILILPFYQEKRKLNKIYFI